MDKKTVDEKKTKPQTEIALTIGEQVLILRGDGTVFLPATGQLLVADLHLGKDASFRAAGIPVPPGINEATLSMLRRSVEELATEETAIHEILILGDLIHNRDSFSNELIEQFAAWQKACKINVHLVLGNHDRHASSFPTSWQLTISKTVSIGNLYLCHEAVEGRVESEGMIQVGGHWHPVTSVGRGADSMRVPCFVIDPWQITLPAFGPFKGGMKQSRKPKRRLFPIAQSMIWQA